MAEKHRLRFSAKQAMRLTTALVAVLITIALAYVAWFIYGVLGDQTRGTEGVSQVKIQGIDEELLGGLERDEQDRLAAPIPSPSRNIFSTGVAGTPGAAPVPAPPASGPSTVQ